MDCFDELLSSSAYVSNRCKYETKDENTKEEDEDAFRNSKILFFLCESSKPYLS